MFKSSIRTDAALSKIKICKAQHNLWIGRWCLYLCAAERVWNQLSLKFKWHLFPNSKYVVKVSQNGLMSRNEMPVFHHCELSQVLTGHWGNAQLRCRQDTRQRTGSSADVGFNEENSKGRNSDRSANAEIPQHLYVRWKKWQNFKKSTEIQSDL